MAIDRRGRGTTDFWYIAWSDQREGLLIDLIRRPQEAVARVAMFRRGQAPRVARQTFPRGALSIADDRTVALGPWRLGPEQCTGGITDDDGTAILVDTRLRLEAPEVTMVPGWVAGLFRAIPALRSTPGTLTALAGQAVAIPCALTRYRIGDLAGARWFLVSTHGFEGAPDVRLEIAGGRVFGTWALTGYLHVGGTWFALNQPLANLVRFSATATGSAASGQRRFEVAYRSKRLSWRLEATASVDAFVELEREGATKISTTLFGDCALELTMGGEQRRLTARGCCLLEVKE